MLAFSRPVNVAFFIYRRPELTRQVFEAIAKARPDRLFVIGDGAKAGSSLERERVAAVREIVSHVDWPAKVFYDFSAVNLGCKQRIVTGLNWVFSHCDDAIILEDDCLPHQDFFSYGACLLDKYRDNSRIMSISGSGFAPPSFFGAGGYAFSRYTHIWGWATWKRAWLNYDVNIPDWPEFKSENWLKKLELSGREIQFWTDMFDISYSGELDSWDFAWNYACWKSNALSITPRNNLVSNIGCDRNGTHIKHKLPVACKPLVALGELVHPLQIVRNKEMDHWIFYESGAYLLPVTLSSRIKNTLLNRHYYGSILRKSPYLWRLWVNFKKRSFKD